MSQMNPLIGPILNQRTLYAMKRYWVSVLSVKSVAFFMWISKRLQGGWDVQDDSGDE